MTRGFDPKTGASLALGAEPVEVPDEIPDSDSTGETRALVQNKSSKEEFEDTEPAVEGATSTEPSENYDDNGTDPITVASTSEDGTVDLSTTTEQTLELTEYDVPVPPYNEASSSQSAVSTTTDNPVE